MYSGSYSEAFAATSDVGSKGKGGIQESRRTPRGGGRASEKVMPWA